MLDVNNVLPTLYKDRKMKNCRSDGSDRKKNRRKKFKKRFQNKCVSSQNKRGRKEEGATATASHLPFLSGLFRLRAGRANRDFSKPLGETH